MAHAPEREPHPAVSKSGASAEDSQVVCCAASGAEIGQIVSQAQRGSCFVFFCYSNRGNEATFVSGGGALMQFCQGIPYWSDFQPYARGYVKIPE